MKWIKRPVEHYWQKTKNKFNQIQVRIANKANLVVMWVVKCKYFLALIATADNCPATFFKVNCFLLGKEHIEIYLQGHTESFADFLKDKVTQINSQLDCRVTISLVEVPGAGSCLVIWKYLLLRK